MKCIITQKENTNASGKNAQNLNGQKLLLAKNYLEQELETLGYRGHVTYDCTNKALVQFRIKEGTISVLRLGNLSIFEMPIKKFNGSLPVEFESVQMDSIKTQNATCCKKCKSWKKQANITRCHCGGYLVPRKRFHIEEIESWDEEFLEIQFARRDIANAVKTERKLSRRPQKYITIGMTHKMAGISSVVSDGITHDSEVLLIPIGDYIKKVLVRPVTSCSLVFTGTIKEDTKVLSDAGKITLLRKYSLESNGTVDGTVDEQTDKIFASEAKRFITTTAPVVSIQLIDSWNHPESKRASKVSKRKVNSLERKFYKCDAKRVSYTKDSSQNSKRSRGVKYTSSMPDPTGSQNTEVIN